MGALTVRFVALAALAGLTACDTPCEFRMVARLGSTGASVGCCGAAVVEDVVVSEQRDLAIDLAQVAIPHQLGGQDMFVTRADCERLFEGAYPAPGTGPRPSPRCPIILGPVAPGRVSPRAELSPGLYRVFVQAYDSNASANAYRFDVGVWGATCGASPVVP
jgi:hypothetical protein